MLQNRDIAGQGAAGYEGLETGEEATWTTSSFSASLGASRRTTPLPAPRRLHDTDEAQLEVAAVGERTADRRIEVRDPAEEFHLRATAAGGVVGGLIGFLTGPIGVLIGGATGAAVGSLVDLSDAENLNRLLPLFGQVVRPGSAATIGVAHEPGVPGSDLRRERRGTGRDHRLGRVPPAVGDDPR